MTEILTLFNQTETVMDWRFLRPQYFYISISKYLSGTTRDKQESNLHWLVQPELGYSMRILLCLYRVFL
ncbi:hypothetical protein BH20ACI1_BH20ACI1_16620 [soil metagenome]